MVASLKSLIINTTNQDVVKATIRIKAANLRTGANIEKTFNSGDRVEDVRLDYHNVQYLYTDGTFFYFMDLETYEQPAIPKSVIGDAEGYLKVELEVKLTFFNNEAIDIELPTSVDLLVTSAEPAVRGDTATGVTKKVELANGFASGCSQFCCGRRYNPCGYPYRRVRHPRYRVGPTSFTIKEY